jgi:hypothetical protein
MKVLKGEIISYLYGFIIAELKKMMFEMTTLSLSGNPGTSPN